MTIGNRKYSDLFPRNWNEVKPEIIDVLNLTYPDYRVQTYINLTFVTCNITETRHPILSGQPEHRRRRWISYFLRSSGRVPSGNEERSSRKIVWMLPENKQAGAEVRNLYDVRWHSIEDGMPGKGTGRHIACFILRGKQGEP